METPKPNKRRMEMAKRCVDQARDSMGPGWRHLSPELRWGLVAANILYAIDALKDDTTAERIATILNELQELCRQLMAELPPVRWED